MTMTWRALMHHSPEQFSLWLDLTETEITVPLGSALRPAITSHFGMVEVFNHR